MFGDHLKFEQAIEVIKDGGLADAGLADESADSQLLPPLGEEDADQFRPSGLATGWPPPSVPVETRSRQSANRNKLFEVATITTVLAF